MAGRAAPAQYAQVMAAAVDSRRQILSGLELATLAVSSAAVLAAVTLLDSDDGLVLCPFRRCTGGYCPGCGASRAASRLLRGDIVGSWAHQPFVLLVGLQASVLTVLLTLTRTSAKQAMQRWAQPFVLANTALILGIWLIRLASGSIPAPDTLQSPF